MTLKQPGYRIYVVNGAEEEVGAHGIKESRYKVRVRCSTTCHGRFGAGPVNCEPDPYLRVKEQREVRKDNSGGTAV